MDKTEKKPDNRISVQLGAGNIFTRSTLPSVGSTIVALLVFVSYIWLAGTNHALHEAEQNAAVRLSQFNSAALAYIRLSVSDRNKDSFKHLFYSKNINGADSKVRVITYSEIKKSGSKNLSRNEIDAWNGVNEYPDKLFSAQTEVNGRLHKLVAKPIVMSSPSCLQCHNQLAGSQNAWKLGDVAGLLATQVDVSQFTEENVSDGLMLTLLAVCLALIIISVALIGGWKSSRAIVLLTGSIRQLSKGVYSQKELRTYEQFAGNCKELLDLEDAYHDLKRGLADTIELIDKSTTHSEEISQMLDSLKAGQPLMAAAKIDVIVQGNIASDGPFAEHIRNHLANYKACAAQLTKLAQDHIWHPALNERVGGILGEQITLTVERQREMAKLAESVSSGNYRVGFSSKRFASGGVGRHYVNMINNVTLLVEELAKRTFSMEAASIGLLNDIENQQTQITGLLSSISSVMDTMSVIDTSTETIGNVADDVCSSVEVSESVINRYGMRVREVSEHVNHIEELVINVKDITSKADILALNAALEGTKAGEVGKGFSLVATRLQFLAEQTMETTLEIEALNEAIHENVRQSAESVSDSVSMTQQTTKSAYAVKSALDKQRKEVRKVIELLGQVGGSAKETLNFVQTSLQHADSIKVASSSIRRIFDKFDIDLTKEVEDV